MLGSKYRAADNTEKAALAYQQIMDIAVLGPELSDPARADALLGAGRGWAELGRRTEAIEAYDQVYLIATRSPYLHLAHRRDLLAELEFAYAQLGEAVQSDVAHQRIVELDLQTGSQPPRETGETPELPIGSQIVSSPEVGALEEARRQAAYALLQSLEVGREPPSPLARSLAEALIAEDAAKLALYRQELETTTQLGRRIDIHRQIISWLTFRYRVAVQGFGLSLVPEWEAQAAEIRSALSKAYEDLYFDYEDLVTGLPDASLIEPGSYRVRRQVILAGRLGLYPNYPERQMADKLRDSARNLIAAGYLDDLFVDMEDRGASLVFFLSPTDQYGLSEQLP
jgi:tetratricopeptide (TPR) repeat protein